MRYKRNLSDVSRYDAEKNKFVFSAPLKFSFIFNPDETTMFFNDLLKTVLDKHGSAQKDIFIDVAHVEELTIDALMYLLAVFNNLKITLRKNIYFSGNAPKKGSVKKKFVDSGFYHYVNYKGQAPITKREDNIQIVSGNNSDTELAKKISDFVCGKASLQKRELSFLYNIMIELMSNTHKHAYNDNTLFNSRWYCFAEYDDNDLVTFSFLDTGEGIPATVRKKFAERVDIMGIKEENKYVVSALQGEFRTSTGKAFRGKGLPKIREICSQNKIQSMRIITSKADIKVYKDMIEAYDISNSLRGTLYYWQMDLSNLRGEKQDDNQN